MAVVVTPIEALDESRCDILVVCKDPDSFNPGMILGLYGPRARVFSRNAALMLEWGRSMENCSYSNSYDLFVWTYRNRRSTREFLIEAFGAPGCQEVDMAEIFKA